MKTTGYQKIFYSSKCSEFHSKFPLFITQRTSAIDGTKLEFFPFKQTTKGKQLWGSHSGSSEDWILLERDAASLRLVLQIFRRISKVEQPKVKALWRILRDVRNSSSSDTLPHFKRHTIFSEKRIWSYCEPFSPSHGEFNANGFGSKS